MKEYKPIMVVYIDEELPIESFNKIEKKFATIKDKFGYENILLMTTSGESRVEIISVDKATIVEDIQKYIDKNI